MTALCLLPLMAFAAFGVDLASLVLAGQLPPEVRRRRRAGRHRVDAEPDQGRPDRVREPPREQHRRRRLRHRPLRGRRSTAGSTANSLLRVTVTDPAADPVLLAGPRQRRPSPHPHRRSRVQPPPPPRQPPQLLRRRHGPNLHPGRASDLWRGLAQPVQHSRRPAVATPGETAQAFRAESCDDSGGRGRVRRTRRTYSSGQSTGSACFYSASIGTLSNGSNAVPPPDYMTRRPDGNSPTSPNPCRVRLGGSGTGTVLGSWSGAPTRTAPGARATRAPGGPPRRTTPPSPRWRPLASRTPGTRPT